MDIYLKKEVLYINIINNNDYKNLVKKVKIIVETYHINNIEININDSGNIVKINKFLKNINNINVKYNLMC